MSSSEFINFDGWFKDSKVVDPKGNPLRLFHATKSNFDEFKIQSRGMEVGFHFGSLDAAERRLRDACSKKKADSFLKGSQIIPVFLSLKNPLDVPDMGNFTIHRLLVSHQPLSSPDPLTGATIELVAGPLVKQGVITEEESIDLQEQCRGIGDYYEIGPRKKLIDLLEKKGFDGFKYVNQYEDKGSTSYVAFRSTQVKSAIGNIGLFSPQNPDITDHRIINSRKALSFLDSFQNQKKLMIP